MPRTSTAPKATDAVGFTPIRIGKKHADAEPDPGVALFYLDDTEYRIPSTVPQGVVLEFLRLSRTEGELVAAQRILERLLGPAAYLALEQSDDVDDDALEQILKAVIHHIAGPPESGVDPQ